MSKNDLEQKLVTLGLNKTVAHNALINNRIKDNLTFILDMFAKHNITIAEITSAKMSSLFYTVATKIPAGFENYIELIMKYIIQKKICTGLQVDEAINYVKSVTKDDFDAKAFEEASGVGITVTRETIRSVLEKFKEKIGPKFNYSSLNNEVKKELKWASGKIIAEEIKAMKKNYRTHSAHENSEVLLDDTSKKISLSKLLARDLYSSLNSLALLEQHRKVAPYPIITRFPPEPNGFLHIGHAKSMRCNFTLASDYGGICYLRYDDTNPETESLECAESAKYFVEWLGYKPYKITYASDYFSQLFSFAMDLVKQDKAYICHQTKEEITEFRKECKDSPWRNRPIKESLELFEQMQEGKFEQKEAVLRLKIDMKNPNSCMKDPVAYRIKRVEHPRTGKKWSIYPTYDFAHCICDSLEQITHSCCTMEFETRRDSYYWVLNALNIYRPYVWEYSRLSITHNVLSKRTIKTLIDEGYVKSWDDPRLLTLAGLKRRGVTPKAINEFCDVIGLTRKGIEVIIPKNVFDQCIRKDAEERAIKAMVVLVPLLVTLINVDENFEEDIIIDGSKRKLTKNIYIDQNDYSSKEARAPCQLTKTQRAMLKSTGWIKFVNEIHDSDKKLRGLEVEYHKLEPKEKEFTGLQWVSSKYAVDAEIRFYDTLFTCENPRDLKDKWRQAVNKNSLKVVKTAKVWDQFNNAKHLDCYQFDNLGYFAIDYDSDLIKKKLVFNRTVSLLAESNSS